MATRAEIGRRMTRAEIERRSGEFQTSERDTLPTGNNKTGSAPNASPSLNVPAESQPLLQIDDPKPPKLLRSRPHVVAMEQAQAPCGRKRCTHGGKTEYHRCARKWRKRCTPDNPSLRKQVKKVSPKWQSSAARKKPTISEENSAYMAISHKGEETHRCAGKWASTSLSKIRGCTAATLARPSKCRGSPAASRSAGCSIHRTLRTRPAHMARQTADSRQYSL